MADRDDGLRHGSITQYGSVRRENSQVLEAHVPSSLVHAEASTSKTHISPPSSFHRRWVSLSDTSLPQSFCRRHTSLIQASKIPESSEVPEALVSPQASEGYHANEVDELVSSHATEDDEPVSP